MAQQVTKERVVNSTPMSPAVKRAVSKARQSVRACNDKMEARKRSGEKIEGWKNKTELVLELRDEAPAKKKVLEGLTEQEQQEVEALTKEFRKAQAVYNALARHSAFKDMLDAVMTEKNPDRANVLEGLWFEHHRMQETLYPVARRVVRPKIAEAALRIVLAETRKVLDPAKELRGMERQIRAALDRALGAKGKVIFGILEELSSLNGLSIDVDFGNEIENELWQDREAIAKACQHVNDGDMSILAKAYTLARQIREAEEND